MMIDAMRNEKGASAVEYAVLLGMIAAVLILAVSFLGSTASSAFHCAGVATGGNTCVQGVQIVTPIVTPKPTHSCTSQNGDNGIGCFGK
jgi:Flp pilus assembly pilin Flp